MGKKRLSNGFRRQNAMKEYPTSLTWPSSRLWKKVQTTGSPGLSSIESIGWRGCKLLKENSVLFKMACRCGACVLYAAHACN